MTDAPLRWAILGTGGVARKFVLDLRQPAARATAQIVASRNPQNAASFAATLPVARAAQSYEEAVTSEDVDAVYIATPPALHEPHALMAIEADKAVLVEKPFAMDAAAATRVAEAARARGVFAMEAMWTRFQPLIPAILARLPDLGTLRGFDGQFCMANTPDPSASLEDPAKGGGALMHRGFYPLMLARLFLGEVTETRAMARLTTGGSDEDCTLMLRHEGGALSTLRAGLRSAGPEGGMIHGTQGTLYIDGPLYRPTGAWVQPTRPGAANTGSAAPRKFEALRESAWGLKLSNTVSNLRKRSKRQVIKAPFQGNGYHYQVAAVADAVAAGQTECPDLPLSDSIRIMTLIDAARAEWSAGA